MFDIRQRDVLGRVGKLRVPRGPVLETPYIFPVIDFLRQEVPVEEIESIGFKGLITNAYLLLKRGVENNVRKVIGASDNTIIMTDSGAYQLMEYGNIDVSNLDIINYQKRVGSDIAVILDYPTGDSLDRNFAKKTVEITLERAKEALPYLDEERIWVLPLQGGVHTDLLRQSAKTSKKLSKYGLYALGSPTRMLENYKYVEVMKMIYIVRKIMPYDKPLHLFGAGHPMFIPFAVALGVDLFDSASYILFAREDRYMTDSGTKRLDDIEYFPCNCPVCSRFSPQDLRELPKKERTRLLAKHNLYVFKKTLDETKQHIMEGRLWDLVRSYSYKHPSLRSAYEFIKRRSRFLERFSPSVPGNVTKPPYFISNETRYNPVVINWMKKNYYVLEQLFKHNTSEIIMIEACLKNVCTHLVNDTVENCILREDCLILFSTENHFVIPYELEKTYPLGHMINYVDTCNGFAFSRKIMKLFETYKPRTIKVLSTRVPKRITEQFKKLGYKPLHSKSIKECSVNVQLTVFSK